MRALNILRAENNVGSERVNLYLNTASIPANGTLRIAGVEKRIPVNIETLHVFADLLPLANWGHPARHMFFSTNGVIVHSEYSNFPADSFLTDAGAFEPLHVPLVHLSPSIPSPIPEFGKRFYLPLPFVPRLRIVAGNRYAILFSGNSNNRHLNDLEFLYRVLIDVYQFNPANIVVLNFDGTLNYSGSPQPVGNWPGNNTPYRLQGNINGAGDRVTFQNALVNMTLRLQANDLLLVHTNNHGGQEDGYGEPWLCG